MNIIIGIIILAASFLFAMLGLGGGMVYVPALNWAGYDLVTVALPLGLLLNGLNTSFALIQFGRKKLVDWKGGAFMAFSALIASPIGAYTSKYVNQGNLKLLFAVVVFAAAIRMLMQANKKEPEAKAQLKKRIIIGIFIGLSVGFLGGLLGIGGGFIFAPVLMALGYIGSQFGARFMSNKAKPKMVKKIYALVLIIIAIKFSWGAISSLLN